MLRWLRATGAHCSHSQALKNFNEKSTERKWIEEWRRPTIFAVMNSKQLCIDKFWPSWPLELLSNSSKRRERNNFILSYNTIAASAWCTNCYTESHMHHETEHGQRRTRCGNEFRKSKSSSKYQQRWIDRHEVVVAHVEPLPLTTHIYEVYYV